MGVNELFTTIKEDNAPNTDPSMKERDANIPREEVTRRSESKCESRETKEFVRSNSSEIVEPEEIGGKQENEPVAPVQISTEDGNGQQDSLVAEQLPPPCHSNNEDLLEAMKNSNICPDDSMKDKPEEDPIRADIDNHQEIEQEIVSDPIDSEVAETRITDDFNGELCTPQSKRVDVDSSSDEEGELETENPHENDQVQETETATGETKVGTLELEEQKSDSSNSLFEDLMMYRRQSSEEEELSEPLELSTHMLSYERFFPGRILGNTFVIRNNASRPVKFRLSFDNSGIDRLSMGERLCEYYG